jgi:hypothetical protein
VVLNLPADHAEGSSQAGSAMAPWPSAIGQMAGLLAGKNPRHIDSLSTNLAALEAAAKLMQANGLNRLADALLKKCVDPRLDLDKLLGVKLKPGRQHDLPVHRESRKAGDLALADLLPGGPSNPSADARSLLALRADGDVRVVSAFVNHKLPCSHRRLSERLRVPGPYREASASDDK